jgi:SAM-dependent methyltransferase
MNPLVSIIIPSWNNMDYLAPCVNSIVRTGALNGLAELIIVNNGDYPLTPIFAGYPSTKVIETGENLGWEKGLARGLKESNAPYVCFQNDDTNIPPACADFYSKMLYPFRDPKVAAVGPSTTTAAGWHSMFMDSPTIQIKPVSYLIFFTVMLERKALEEAGGVDITAPGGDDLDLSIRLRKMGRTLVVNPAAFLIHHGFKSGTRLRGDHTKHDGWNSLEMRDKTNQWLIQKHGFKTVLFTQQGYVEQTVNGQTSDSEGNKIRSLITEGKTVLELGCGGQKTVPSAIGVDRVPHGAIIPHVGVPSVADIVADVDKPLNETLKEKFDVVIARHILEHCVDTVGTLKEWSSLLKDGGQLIIAVPNEEICKSIPMNPEHVHAFTPTSLSSIAEACGLVVDQVVDSENNVSFIGSFRKPSRNGKTVSESMEACLA